MNVLLALEFGFIWILGRWHQRGFEETPDLTTQKMDLQVGEHKWRPRALRYPQAGRETVFPGHASGVAAVFSSSRGWECIHTYVVQQEQYNQFEQQVSSQLLTAALLYTSLESSQDTSSAFSEQCEDLTR
jgi:hypothetical protein